MDIIGIEVIPGYIGVTPGQKVQLTYGDRLQVNTSFDFQGSARQVTLYGAIGTRKPVIGFDEVISAEQAVSLPETPLSPTNIKATVLIPITADIAPDKTYDLYVKIKEYPGAGLPEVDGVVDIVGTPPTFTLLEETIYPYAYVYDGKAEIHTFTFKSDPFTPANWIAGKLAANVEKQVKQAGGRIMELRVYVDQTPLLWNNWRIEAVIQTPAATAGLGMSLGIAWFAVAILAALAIILIIVITWSIKTIVSTFTHKAISEEVKAAWSRETLIGAIGDFETKLKRTPTPKEDLEKKSDDELRKYCDELASAVAPPVSGAGLAIAIIGAGVLGMGALAIVGYAMSRPKEIR